MPICHKCLTRFPSRLRYPNGSIWYVQKRKYCPDCIPAGQSTLQPPRDKSKQLQCELCGTYYWYNKHLRTTLTRCCTCVSRLKFMRSKQRAVEYMGGSCKICGYNKYNGALTFHHINPKKKDRIISTIGNKTWIRIKHELDKCMMLCTRCHAEVHAGLHRQYPVSNKRTGLLLKNL